MQIIASGIVDLDAFHRPKGACSDVTAEAACTLQRSKEYDMTCFTHTITLGIAALAVTGTAALAASSGPTGIGMERMHEAVHTDEFTGHGHDQMIDDAMAAMHEAMADNPQMREHLDHFGVDIDEMDAWMAAGRTHEAIHDELLDRGVDVEQMMQTCPMAGTHHRGSVTMHHGPRGHGEVHERHHGG